jgi:hypothetical protein
LFRLWYSRKSKKALELSVCRRGRAELSGLLPRLEWCFTSPSSTFTDSPAHIRPFSSSVLEISVCNYGPTPASYTSAGLYPANGLAGQARAFGAWPGTQNKNGPCHVDPLGLRRSSGTARSPLTGLCRAGGPTGPTMLDRSEARINFYIFIFHNFCVVIKNLFNIIKFELKIYDFIFK